MRSFVTMIFQIFKPKVVIKSLDDFEKERPPDEIFFVDWNRKIKHLKYSGEYSIKVRNGRIKSVKFWYEPILSGHTPEYVDCKNKWFKTYEEAYNSIK